MKPIFVCLAISVGFAFLMLYVAFQDNNQGEFFDIQTGAINYKNSAELVVRTSTTLFITGLGFIGVWRVLQKKKGH